MLQMGTGWIPDPPDDRDYTPHTPHVQPLLHQVGAAAPGSVALPASVDLRQWFPAIFDQGRLNSCTAQTATALMEYFQKRSFGDVIPIIPSSRLFLYKVSRNMLRQSGDRGAFLRTAMGALTLFGVPPEEYWPYVESRVDTEPPAFCYAFAENYKAISYYRYDPPGTAREDLLQRIKTNLAAQLPAMFGFYMFASLNQARTTGKIPYPVPGEQPVGLHAIVAVGYDDNMTIQNTGAGGSPTQGALLIRNSWGTDWGDQGYGWLPYKYVLDHLAEDWWSLIDAKWIDSGEFAVSGSSSASSTLPYLDQVGTPLETDPLTHVSPQVGSAALVGSLDNYRGESSIGPLKIQSRISLDPAEIRGDVELLGVNLGTIHLTPSHASTEFSGNVGVAKAEVTLTADFTSHTLLYDVRACLLSGLTHWKCKAYSGVLDTWRLTQSTTQAGSDQPGADGTPSSASAAAVQARDRANESRHFLQSISTNFEAVTAAIATYHSNVESSGAEALIGRANRAAQLSSHTATALATALTQTVDAYNAAEATVTSLTVAHAQATVAATANASTAIAAVRQVVEEFNGTALVISSEAEANATRLHAEAESNRTSSTLQAASVANTQAVQASSLATEVQNLHTQLQTAVQKATDAHAAANTTLQVIQAG